MGFLSVNLRLCPYRGCLFVFVGVSHIYRYIWYTPGFSLWLYDGGFSNLICYPYRGCVCGGRDGVNGHI